jgi:hypothetical protein
LAKHNRLMPNFAATLPQNRLTVADFTDRLKAFLDAAWRAYPNPPGTVHTGFIVAGYDADPPRPAMFQFNVGVPIPKARVPGNIAMGGLSTVIAERLMFGGGSAPTDDEIRKRLSNLSADDLKKIIDRLHRETYHPASSSVQSTAVLVRYVIDTTTEIQDSLSVQNVFSLGGRPDIATITSARGFQR